MTNKPSSTVGPLSFTNAAEHVLRTHADGKPLRYKEITAIALEQGLIKTSGLTPTATMSAQIFEECKRRKKRGVNLRFDRLGRGMVGLISDKVIGVEGQIARHNDSIRKQLHERLNELKPADFEILVGRLLTALGFEDVDVTKVHGDGGIDARGTLVVGDVINTRMAVQAKRWKKGNNVQAPTVQQVRGSLGAHEQGLIITTSDFSKGAREEARRLDAIPVGLMNGDQLINLLVEYEIGITREPHEMLRLIEDETEDAAL